MAESTFEEESEFDTKPIKDLPVIQDQGFFRHDTGDTYDGFFEAKKKDRSVKMHGLGVYTTAEGDAYSGAWDSDRLGGSEDVSIAFTDGSIYRGLLIDWSYSGQGKYIYADSSVLMGNFVDNTPTGQMTLMDPNGHKWRGIAEQGFGWFNPVNHFYEMLERTRDAKKCVRMELGSRPTVSKINTVQSVYDDDDLNDDKLNKVDM